MKQAKEFIEPVIEVFKRNELPISIKAIKELSNLVLDAYFEGRELELDNSKAMLDKLGAVIDGVKK